MSGEAEVIGLKELLRGLSIADKLVARETRRAVATYARMARDEVKAATPRGDTLNLVRSIKVASSKPKRGVYSYRVVASKDGARTGKGYHYHLVEYGTVKMDARHFAEPIKRKYSADASGRLNSMLNAGVERALTEVANAR